jgi:regulation of enolase protein 1 (concanavalin A-like superfamily)
MGRNLAGLTLCVLVASMTIGPVAYAGDPTLVGWWKCNDGEGTTARDSSGYGNDGTLHGGPQWSVGRFGGSLEFDGADDYVDCGSDPSLDLTTWTIAFWLNAVENKNYNGFLIKGLDAAENYEFLGFADGSFHMPIMMVTGARTYVNTATGVIVVGEWTHFAYIYDSTVGRQVYKNGTQIFDDAETGTPRPSTSPLILGNEGGMTRFTHGAMDDIRIYSRILTADELSDVILGKGPDAELADNPSPENEATDVPRDASFAWEPGEFAATHDVYLGTTFEDVNNATRDNPMGALVSKNQADAAYDPTDLLEYGRTYYWRIDEVNAAPDGTVFKGETWSFTVEPYAYPVTPVAATASGFQPGMGPENTINGSGLNAENQHSVNLPDMWMAPSRPAWVQYEFDKVYKFDALWVWNSNQVIEPFLGFGAKTVTIEYSVDAETWATLENVPEFAKATGAATYTAGTIVDMAGVTARFVKLTIEAGWGGLPQTGLSEVRFFYVPLQAFAPQPAAAATDVSLGTELTWRPGREATSHAVYFGADGDAVAQGAVSAQTVTDHSYTPAGMEYGVPYFWRVDEVGDAGTYAGDVWSFTSQEFAFADDFEGYNDDDNRIYSAWIDGVTTQASGSQVGYDESPFAEQTILHGGKQSMPFMYDNRESPYVSEAEREFDPAQNWTGSGASEVCIWTRGYPAPTAVAVTEANGKMSLTGAGADIWNNSDEFTYAYKTLAGDGSLVARVASNGTGSNTWAKGGVMIRDNVNGGSTHATMVLTGSAGNGASFQYRAAANGGSGNSDSTVAIAPPYWVKIERAGESFTGSVSADGKTWVRVGSAAVPMEDPVLIGLAVTSHAVGENRTYDFDGITATGAVSGSWQGAVIDKALYNDAASMYLTIQDSAGKSATIVSDTAATAADWTRWTAPMSDFTGVNFAKVQKIILGVGTKGAATPGGKGIVFIDDIGYGRSAQ